MIWKMWAENGARTRHLQLGRLSLYQMSYFRGWDLWERKDSNLRRLSQQIYSLSHLTALELSQRFSFRAQERADSRTWTNDRLITNQLLYQLSYIGTDLSKNSLLFRGRKNSLFSIWCYTGSAFFLIFYHNALIYCFIIFRFILFPRLNTALLTPFSESFPPLVRSKSWNA